MREDDILDFILHIAPSFQTTKNIDISISFLFCFLNGRQKGTFRTVGHHQQT
jgi:hypothetical protein